MADKVWRRGQGGHKVDTWRTRFAGAAKVDTRRTHAGQAPGTRPEHIAASPFFPKREPHSKLFGEKKNFPSASGALELEEPMAAANR